MDDLIEELIIGGLYQFVRFAFQLQYEVGHDLVGIVLESRGPTAPGNEERLARLRRWNERVERSLPSPAA
jgi:hypothetical protein